MDCAFLKGNFSLDEIKNDIWNCGGDTASGLDAFTFRFINKYCNVMQDDVMRFVKYFEASGRFARGCSSSFITLIPKLKDPLTFNGYCCISLIGCLYKINTKVLANRVKMSS